MIGAYAGVSAQVFEGRQLAGSGFNEAARSANHFDLRIGCHCVTRTAAEARAKAGVLSSFGNAKENNLLAARAARRTRRPAVDAGRAHGEEYPSIKPDVAFEHGSPEGFVVRGLRAYTRISLCHWCRCLAHFSASTSILEQNSNLNLSETCVQTWDLRARAVRRTVRFTRILNQSDENHIFNSTSFSLRHCAAAMDGAK
jgi:hypothetical protein